MIAENNNAEKESLLKKDWTEPTIEIISKDIVKHGTVDGVDGGSDSNGGAS
jgi:hypothetical protein